MSFESRLFLAVCLICLLKDLSYLLQVSLLLVPKVSDVGIRGSDAFLAFLRSYENRSAIATLREWITCLGGHDSR